MTVCMSCFDCHTVVGGWVVMHLAADDLAHVHGGLGGQARLVADDHAGAALRSRRAQAAPTAAQGRQACMRRPACRTCCAWVTAT